MEFFTKKEKGVIEDNAKLEAFLRTTKTVTDDIWNKIVDAIKYDSATTVNWAFRKLKIIYLRTQNGEEIYIPTIQKKLDKKNFQTIMIELFGEFHMNCILEYEV